MLDVVAVVLAVLACVLAALALRRTPRRPTGDGVDALPEEELRTTLDHGPGLLLVATDPTAGDRVVGTVLGTFDGRRGWIHRLAVHPDHRRRGIGDALVTEVEARLAALGAPRVNLLVLPENAGALRFWRRRGYLACPDVLHTRPLGG